MAEHRMSEHREGFLPSDDGLQIYHQSWLPDGRPRSVVLLFHGLGEHSGRYAHVAEELNQAGHAVCALDHRGHGRSEGKRVFVRSYDELQRDLWTFRQHVEACHPDTPLVVLGHSMGGNLAVGHVLAHPAGLAGLVLSAPAIKAGDDFSPLQLKLFRLIAKIAPGVRPQALDATLISRDPLVVQAYRDDPLVYTGKVTAGIGAALLGAMQGFPARYAELQLPVLVLHGTDDALASIEGSRELEAKAVNAEVTAHYYEGLYHEVFNEPERERVIGDLVAWLDALVSAG